MNGETSFRLLRALVATSDSPQRRLARDLGMSLGKLNYCLNALIDKGLVKVENFRASTNKPAYLYKLTPKGLREKATVAIRFLRRKVAEYEAFKTEIAVLKTEVARGNGWKPVA